MSSQLTPTEQLAECRQKYCSLPKSKAGINQFGCCCCYVLVLAIALILVAIAAPIVLNNTLDSELKKAGILDSPDSPLWATWSGTSSDGPGYAILRMYLYDYLNPLEMLEGAPPAVREVGPFVYYNYAKVIEANWTADKTVLSYKKYSYYVFQPDQSIGDPQLINITSVNMPYVGINAIFMRPDMKSFGPPLMLKSYPPGSISDVDKAFTSRSCYEHIWGFDDPAMQILHSAVAEIPSRYPGFLQNMTSDEMAQWKAKTDAIYTGVDDINKIRVMHTYQDQIGNLTSCTLPPCVDGKGFNPTWASIDASRIRGHDGGAFPPGVKATDVLQMWIPTYYRPVDLVYTRTRQLKGVSVFDFEVAPYETFPSLVRPSNGLYYQNGSTGFYNISGVLGQIPTYMCKPRFEDVDPAVYKDYLIFPVDREPKPTIISVEPRSGFSLAAKARAQLNVRIGPTRGLPPGSYPVPRTVKIWNITWFPELREMIAPVMWAEVEGEIDEAGADKWVEQIYGTMALITISRYVGAVGGTVLLAAAIIGLSWVRYHRKGRAGEYSIGDDKDDNGSAGTGTGTGTGSLPSDAQLLHNSSMLDGPNITGGGGGDGGGAVSPMLSPATTAARGGAVPSEGTGLLAATAASPQFGTGGGDIAQPTFSPMPNRSSAITDMPLTSAAATGSYQN